jgi:hypothetical protein
MSGNTYPQHEQWIWTELIGFDNRQSDLGVGGYLEAAGFVPDAICLLMSSVDFVLLHSGIDQEKPLHRDFCSREGHERNQLRERQVWTDHQLRRLIERLHDHGIAVYLSVFAQVFENRWHQEWACDHQEVRALYASSGRRGGINSLKRLRDGSYYEDYLLRQLLAVLGDYGFDGWHGADGYGPLSGAIYETDFSDDMVAQFSQGRRVSLPDSVMRLCDEDSDRLRERARWIWRNARHEWIEFYADRWAGFWRKMVDGLHGAGKKAVINSAWGRAPFESWYRYGVDYKRIVATGVDGIVVETVAAALTLDSRCGDASRHFDFLSMLMLIRAYVPETKLIFLHNTHDIVEQWDVLRHGPAVLEKEIYSLANVYHCTAEGTLKRSADGFLACLGDGLSPAEWRWLRERWSLAFGPQPQRALGATLVWSDAAMRSQLDDFTRTRTWTTHRLLFHLMTRGAPVQATVNVNDLSAVTGPLLVLNLHLFPPSEQQRILSYSNGPVIAVGRRAEAVPEPQVHFEDVHGPNQLCCSVYGTSETLSLTIEGSAEEEIPRDLLEVTEPPGYWDHLYFRKVSESFLDACVHVLMEYADCYRVLSDEDDVTVMITQQTQRTLRIAVKSKAHVYRSPQIDLGEQITSLTVLSSFPMVSLQPEGSRFTVKVPPLGVAVVEATLASLPA